MYHVNVFTYLYTTVKITANVDGFVRIANHVKKMLNMEPLLQFTSTFLIKLKLRKAYKLIYYER